MNVPTRLVVSALALVPGIALMGIGVTDSGPGGMITAFAGMGLLALGGYNVILLASRWRETAREIDAWSAAHRGQAVALGLLYIALGSAIVGATIWASAGGGDTRWQTRAITGAVLVCAGLVGFGGYLVYRALVPRKLPQ